MPYSIIMVMRNGMEKHCVVKDATHETMGCHDTHQDAVDHQRALHANEGYGAVNLMDPVRRSP